MADAYSILLEDNGMHYRRKCLLSTKLDWYYVGVLHEYPEAGVDHSEGAIDGVKILRRVEGGRSQGRDPSVKYLNDARILEQGLIDEPDNSRYVFYLAQSYRDAGQFKQSLKTYQRRATMGGWSEEVWYSLYEVAKLSERLGDDAAVITQRYLDAYQARPSRAEPLVELARLFRERKQFALAHLFASKAKDTPRPGDILFLDAAAYDWRALDEYAVASYWVGNYRECAKSCETLLNTPALPYNHLARVTENLNFALAKLGRR